ncbi:hypothetical protein BMR02_14510, partial [Methylococcaceae bacterium HT1]
GIIIALPTRIHIEPFAASQGGGVLIYVTADGSSTILGMIKCIISCLGIRLRPTIIAPPQHLQLCAGVVLVCVISSSGQILARTANTII